MRARMHGSRHNLAAVDLSACDREPIHTPGRVQPHGALLALREPSLTVACASETCVKPLSYGVPRMQFCLRTFRLTGTCTSWTWAAAASSSGF